MKLFDRLTAEQRKYLDKLLSKTEATVTDTYRAALIELKAEMLDLATRYGQKGILNATEMNRFNRYSEMMNSIRSKIADSMGKAHSEMKKTVAETYLETRAMTAYAMDMAAGRPIGFGRIDEAELSKAVNDKYSKLADSKALASDKARAFSIVKNEINLSMARGEDVGATARRVAAVLGFRDKDGDVTPNGRGELYKAMRIARTETHRIQSQGQNDAFKEAQDLGVEVEKVWDAALDDRTRDSHGEMDSQVADENGLFTLPGGVKTEGPGQSGIAEEDINCRCVARLQVKRFPPSVKRTGDGVEPWQSYKEWKEGQAKNGGETSPQPEENKDKKTDTTNEELPKTNQEPEAQVNEPEQILKYPEYEDQSSVKAAETWAIKNNISDMASYKGASVEVSNEWNRVIVEHLQDFPELRPTFQFIGTTQERQRKYVELRVEELINDPRMKQIYEGDLESLKKRALAKARSEAGKTPQGVIAYSIKNRLTSGICISTKFAKSLQDVEKVVERGVSSGHFPEGVKGIRHIVSHELGHELDKLLDLRRSKELYDIINGWNIRTQLSGYATTSAAEVIAEAWGEYKCSPSPRPLAKAIAEFILRVYNEKFGGKK